MNINFRAKYPLFRVQLDSSQLAAKSTPNISVKVSKRGRPVLARKGLLLGKSTFQKVVQAASPTLMAERELCHAKRRKEGSTHIHDCIRVKGHEKLDESLAKEHRCICRQDNWTD
jgi:hypothetical protein